jgi:cysteine-rich repeat protein
VAMGACGRSRRSGTESSGGAAGRGTGGTSGTAGNQGSAAGTAGDDGGAGTMAGHEGGAAGNPAPEGGAGGERPETDCGNGVIDATESCDDGNSSEGDGCASCVIEAGFRCDDSEPSACVDIDECSDAASPCDEHAVCSNVPGSFECACERGYSGNGRTCSASIRAVAGGSHHTCVAFASGSVRCWGLGTEGALGYGNADHIGDDETAADAGDVEVGGIVRSIAAGWWFTCAVLDTGAVRCWGYGVNGKLGYGNTESVGDDEVPAEVGEVDVGGKVRQVVAGGNHTCALLENGAVRCWGGAGNSAELGYGNGAKIGDDEAPASAGDVDVGGPVVQLAAGFGHTCALLTGGAVRCWGRADKGQLGYGNKNDVGDDEVPAAAGNVDVGGAVVQIAAGAEQTCAVLATGGVRCWGYGAQGRLGYGDTNNLGDDETPGAVGDIDVGGKVTQIATGFAHTCALMTTGNVRCWGYGIWGQHGHGHTNDIGDDETPSSAGDVDLGGKVRKLAIGDNHTCAHMTTGALRCWGDGSGKLGYGNETIVGDDETPASAGDVPLL